MHLRRLISVLSVVVVVASGVVAAQPKKADQKKKPKPPAAAKGSAAGSAAKGSAAGSAAKGSAAGSAAKGSAAGSAAASPKGSAAGSAAGSAVTPIEEAPPKDIEGKEENPEGPRGPENEEPPTAAPPKKKTGYPIEEAQRPITLFQNMAEVSIAPHFQVDPFRGTDALRARYGITAKAQIGLTYAYGGVYDLKDVGASATKSYSFHPGKAVGLDFTYSVYDWMAFRLGVPVYIDPFAMSLAIGVPLKFHFGDKVAIGGLDDLLNITLKTFPPSFYSERENAKATQQETVGGTQSKGDIRFSAYGIYQYQPQLALIGRLSVDFDDFSQNRDTSGYGGIKTAIRAGADYAVKKYLDVGGSLGWDDLSTVGSFGLALYLAVRI